MPHVEVPCSDLPCADHSKTPPAGLWPSSRIVPALRRQSPKSSPRGPRIRASVSQLHLPMRGVSRLSWCCPLIRQPTPFGRKLFPGGSPTVPMIRRFAWCGTNSAMSDAVSPARCSEIREDQPQLILHCERLPGRSSTFRGSVWRTVGPNGCRRPPCPIHGANRALRRLRARRRQLRPRNGTPLPDLTGGHLCKGLRSDEEHPIDSGGHQACRCHQAVDEARTSHIDIHGAAPNASCSGDAC